MLFLLACNAAVLGKAGGGALQVRATRRLCPT
jgi:hypothetical protein